MTPSEELRAAATRLRQLAAEAERSVPRPEWEHEWLDDAWIAAMSPAVAEPLALILEGEAYRIEWSDKWENVAPHARCYRDLARLILEATP